MPQYSFRCPSCRNTYTVIDLDHVPPCMTCGAHPTRVWSFNHSRAFPEHFNNSVGEFVSNKHQFYDGLKRQSEVQSARTGIEHDFQPVDPTDMRDASAHGVTDEGLDDTNRRLRQLKD